jgi:hypothetical protein
MILPDEFPIPDGARSHETMVYCMSLTENTSALRP